MPVFVSAGWVKFFGAIMERPKGAFVGVRIGTVREYLRAIRK